MFVDQPTIVKNLTGQRPVEQIVSSIVGSRYGGMQPAYTGKLDMFGPEAPIWSFLARFGGAANPLLPSMRTEVIETYPVLMMISLGWSLTDMRPGGRLPKYNPDRRETFSRSDWEYVCVRARDAVVTFNLAEMAKWLDEMARLARPRKTDQDKLDAVLCLLAALHMVVGNDCIMVGDCDTGYIVVPDCTTVREELEARCRKTRRLPREWVRVFRTVASSPAVYQ